MSIYRNADLVGEIRGRVEVHSGGRGCCSSIGGVGMVNRVVSDVVVSSGGIG